MEIINFFKRLKNRVKIWYKEHFKGTVKRIKIEDENGKEHEVIVEREVQKVCDHKTITEIAPTMWACTSCEDVYFQIGYKVMLTPQDLNSYVTDLANHIGMELKEKDNG